MFEVNGTVAGMPVNLQVHVDSEIASDLQMAVAEAMIEQLPQLVDKLFDSYLGMLHHPGIMEKADQLANQIGEMIKQAQVAAAVSRYS